MTQKVFIEVQFPIGPLSLESYKERDAKVQRSSLRSASGGVRSRWCWSAPSSSERYSLRRMIQSWPDDLEIFMKLMCLDNAGMWKRKTDPLPAQLCLSAGHGQGAKGAIRGGRRALEAWRPVRPAPSTGAARVLHARHTEQREYCCRVEEIDGPPGGVWIEINAYLGTKAKTLPELVQQLSQRRFGARLKVGDAFSAWGRFLSRPLNSAVTFTRRT